MIFNKIVELFHSNFTTMGRIDARAEKAAGEWFDEYAASKWCADTQSYRCNLCDTEFTEPYFINEHLACDECL